MLFFKGVEKMTHYNAYDSFQTKKSKDKKQRAKEKSLGTKTDIIDDFIVKDIDANGIIIEVRYDDAYVLYEDNVVLAKLRKDINRYVIKFYILVIKLI